MRREYLSPTYLSTTGTSNVDSSCNIIVDEQPQHNMALDMSPSVTPSDPAMYSDVQSEDNKEVN